MSTTVAGESTPPIRGADTALLPLLAGMRLRGRGPDEVRLVERAYEVARDATATRSAGPETPTSPIRSAWR